jgi:hypothetical protein
MIETNGNPSNHADVEGEGLIKILVPQRSVQEPNLPIQWCISKALIEGLEEKSVVDPYLLICVTNADGIEVRGARQLVPLLQLQTRVEFHKPGPHTLHARVVWGGLKQLRSYYLSRENGRSNADYTCDVFNRWNRLSKLEAEAEDAGKALDYAEVHRGLSIDKVTVSDGLGLATHTVVIADNVFAPPPPAWLAWWLMFPWGGTFSLENQCHLRRSFLLSLPKIVWAPLGAILIVLLKGLPGVLWTTLFLAKDYDWWQVRHPFLGFRAGRGVFPHRYGGIRSQGDDIRFLGSIAFGKAFPWNERQDCNGEFWWGSIPLLLLMPVIWIGIAAIGAGHCKLFGIEPTTLLSLILYGMLGLLEIVAAIAVIGAGCFAIDFVRGGDLSEYLRQLEENRAKRMAEAGELEERFQDLVCDGPTAFQSFGNLRRKSATLIFSEVKAALCRPYAR